MGSNNDHIHVPPPSFYKTWRRLHDTPFILNLTKTKIIIKVLFLINRDDSKILKQQMSAIRNGYTETSCLILCFKNKYVNDFQ